MASSAAATADAAPAAQPGPDTAAAADDADAARQARLAELAAPALPPRAAFLQVDEYETGWLAGAPHAGGPPPHHPPRSALKCEMLRVSLPLQRATWAQRFGWRGWH